MCVCVCASEVECVSRKTIRMLMRTSQEREMNGPRKGIELDNSGKKTHLLVRGHKLGHHGAKDRRREAGKETQC